MPSPVVEAQGLSERYGATVGLEGLDLAVERGEVLGVLGPNAVTRSSGAAGTLLLLSLAAISTALAFLRFQRRDV